MYASTDSKFGHLRLSTITLHFRMINYHPIKVQQPPGSISRNTLWHILKLKNTLKSLFTLTKTANSLSIKMATAQWPLSNCSPAPGLLLFSTSAPIPILDVSLLNPTSRSPLLLVEWMLRLSSCDEPIALSVSNVSSLTTFPLSMDCFVGFTGVGGALERELDLDKRLGDDGGDIDTTLDPLLVTLIRVTWFRSFPCVVLLILCARSRLMYPS